MYRRIEWMKPVDHAILSLLGGTQHLALTPNNDAKNIDYDNEYVSRRCKLLAEHGLVSRDASTSDPFYAINAFGEQYLAGELDVSELEASEE